MKKETLGNLFLLVFCGLATGVALQSSWVNELDYLTQQFLRLTPTDGLTTFFLGMSRFGNHITIAVVSVLIVAGLIFYKKRLLALWFSATFLICGTVVPFVLKYLFGRPRPADGLFSRTGYSFPSGHSTGATVFYGLVIVLALMLLEKKSHKFIVITASSSLVVFVLWARVYLGFHFSTDVLASLMLGTGQVIWSTVFYPVMARRLKEVPAFATI